MHIFRLAARAPCHSAPVTSALGVGMTHEPSMCDLASESSTRVNSRLRSFPAAQDPVDEDRSQLEEASLLLPPPDPRLPCLRRLSPAIPAATSNKAEPRAIGTRTQGSEGLSVVNTALNAFGSQCFSWRRPRGAPATVANQRARPVPTPNWSLNRSANGWPPCPRGARCLCCTSRTRRPPVVARLTLR